MRISKKPEAADTVRLHNRKAHPMVHSSSRYRRDERNFIAVLKNGTVVRIDKIPREPGGSFVADDAGKPRFKDCPEIVGSHRFRNENLDSIASGERLKLRKKFKFHFTL